MFSPLRAMLILDPTPSSKKIMEEKKGDDQTTQTPVMDICLSVVVVIFLSVYIVVVSFTSQTPRWRNSASAHVAGMKQ